MPEKTKSAIPRIVFKTCVFIVFSVMSAFLILNGLDLTRELHFGYKEQGNIEYSVALKGDNFLNTTTQEAGETYFADLIDQIKANFQYGADFTESVTGDYTYQFIATISAQKANGENYWSQRYELTEPSTQKLKNARKLRIDVTQNIDYQKYNQILQDFITTYRLTTAGKLQVSMVINGEFQAAITDQLAALDSSIDFTVPLASDSVDVTITTNTDNNGKIYTKKVNIDDDVRRFSRIAGSLLAAATIYLVICQILAILRERKAHLYEYSVAKLREEYDDIIVDIKEAPKTTGLNIVAVAEFDELLDVYNSIKMPINYYEAKDGAHFILINGKLAWQYIAKKTDFIEKTVPRRHRSARRRK